MKRRTFLKLLPASLVTLLWPRDVIESQPDTSTANNATPYGQGNYSAGPYSGFLAKFRAYLPTITRRNE